MTSSAMVPQALRRLWVVGLALAIAAAVAVPAAAQQRKKITLDDLVIEGNIQKPEAFFILPRTNLNFADLERREDLKSRVVESVEAAPF
jgi:hypothetical protein